MDQMRCPGQDQRYWKPEDIFEMTCPWCRATIEFWKDEPLRTCPGCHKEVRNSRIDLGCAKWCKSAADCLGVMPQDDAAVASVRERLIAEMKAEFADHPACIEHTLQVLANAEALQVVEGGDPVVVRAAAILHDIGIPAALRAHGSMAGSFQEMEGPAIAREMMERNEVPAPIIEHVSRIIGSHHSAKDIDTREFKIVWDADWLVNFAEEFSDLEPDEKEPMMRTIFRTNKGLDLARERLLG